MGAQKALITRDALFDAFHAAITSSAAQALAMRTSKRPRNPWRQGACLVLAEAVVGWLGEENVQVWELSGAGHIFVRAGDFTIDGGGILSLDEFRRQWSVEGGFDFDTERMYTTSIIAAEKSGYEFDDWATPRLARLLDRVASRVEALVVLRG